MAPSLSNVKFTMRIFAGRLSPGVIIGLIHGRLPYFITGMVDRKIVCLEFGHVMNDMTNLMPHETFNLFVVESGIDDITCEENDHGFTRIRIPRRIHDTRIETITFIGLDHINAMLSQGFAELFSDPPQIWVSLSYCQCHRPRSHHQLFLYISSFRKAFL